MEKSTETIDQATLARLIDARSIRTATLLGVAGGWSVVVRYGVHERFLAVKRGRIRQFRNLDTAVSFLRKQGIARFDVDATGYEERPGVSRPDKAEALRKLHSHDRWFREQIESALAEADDPEATWVSGQDVRERWLTRRDQLVSDRN